MNALRLESFRALGDTGFVRMRPLTVLVGKNSSGKSTFLRFLPLMRQSVQSRTTGPILWYGDYVDFGGFRETVSTFSDSDQIRFGFQLPLTTSGRIAYTRRRSLRTPQARRPDPKDAIQCELTLAIEPDPNDNSVTRFRSVNIVAAGHTIRIGLEGGRRIAEVVVNGQNPFQGSCDELQVETGYLLPTIHRRRSPSQTIDIQRRYLGRRYGRPLAFAELVESLRPMFHGNTAESTIEDVARRTSFGSDKEIHSSLGRTGKRSRSWGAALRSLELSGSSFKAVRNLVVANALGDLLGDLDEQIWAFASGVRYIKPVRATAERYYRQQALAVDEVDPKGHNLAMFLRSLTKAERRDFEEWTLEEFEWRIVAKADGGHVVLRIEEHEEESHNLTDVGFGFSQILPVVAQLWSMRRRRRGVRYRHHDKPTLAIEQPELHLHPGLQARLADVLIRAIASANKDRIGLRVVLETHSEAIVNRIGQRIAAGHLDPEQAAVVLFEPTGSGRPSRVRTATFDTNGFLRNWPFGFFEPE